jgi:tetratricopeptide (TPR) repeat protein
VSIQLLTGLVQITLHFLQLLLSHYRLRQHIKECLVERADHDPDVEIRQNAAFQLAICYSVGFGCSRNETEAEKWLKLSESPASELSSAMCFLLDEQDIVYENKAIAALVRNGNFQSLEYGLEFRQEPSLHQVEEEYRREIHDLSAALGSDHVGVLNLRMILAGIMMDQGRFPEAEQAVRQTLDRYTARLRLDHQETLRCTTVLATILEENDRFEESKSLHQVVLEQRVRLLGPNHLDTLESARQLGTVLQSLGEFEEAGAMATRDYEGRLVVLGEMHPDVYKSMANVASITQDMGHLNDSVWWNERALEGRTQVLGREHPQTLTSISNLASVLQEMGEYEEAEPLFREDLDLSRRTFGEEHQDTITALSNLGLLYMDMERYDEAEQITREALIMGEKAQGYDHSATLISSNLALVLGKTERYKETEELLREVLHSRERLFEPSNLLIATSIYNLAANYAHQGRLEEAMRLHEKAPQVRKTKLGEKHPFTLESMTDVGHIMRVWHRFSEAEDLLRTVLRTRVEVLGYDHSDTHDALGELICVLHDQGKGGEVAEELGRFAEEQGAEEESDEEVVQ